MQVTSPATELFFTTVRIETFPGGDIGTGFFATRKVKESGCPFIVTARHVVEETHGGYFSLLKQVDGEPELGSELTFNFTSEADRWKEMWVTHPDPEVDIAVCPLHHLVEQAKQLHGTDLFYLSTLISTSEKMEEELDALESVVFVGYPYDIWDKKNLLPILRGGITASLIKVDFEGKPCFLIDASVFPGSSGSPVFVFDQNHSTNERGAASHFRFVGVLSAGYFRDEKGTLVAKPIPTQAHSMAEWREMVDLGVVVKARTVGETMDVFLKAHNLLI